MKILERFVVLYSSIFNLFLITFFILFFDKMKDGKNFNLSEFIFWGFGIIIYTIINYFFALTIFRKNQKLKN